MTGARATFPLELSTERLEMRAPHPDQAETVVAAIQDSFETLHRWMDWAMEPPTVEWQRDHLASNRKRHENGELLSFFLFLRDDGTLVGNCGIPRLDWEQGRFEIGYWCHTAHEGRGYVSEAVRALTRLVFERFQAQRVELRTSDANQKSWRVAERCGFTLERVIQRDGTHPDGSPRDTRIYVRTYAGD